MNHVDTSVHDKIAGVHHAPGFLLTPFGWAAEPLAALVNAENIATDCGGELYELTDPKFVGQHGGSVSSVKANRMYRKTGAGRRICKMVKGGEARAPDRKIRGSAGTPASATP
jgi:hypothetical protein